MITLELDDEAESVLAELVKLEQSSPAQLVKQMLLEHLEDYRDATRAERAYQRYLDSGKQSYDLHDVVTELGLDS